MALLDMTEAFDPLFLSEVTLRPRVGAYDELGEFHVIDGTPTTVQAIVTSATFLLETLPEELRRAGSISVRVHTSELPQGFGKSHDRIEFDGKLYEITATNSGRQIGSGLRFICAPCGVEEEDMNGY